MLYNSNYTENATSPCNENALQQCASNDAPADRRYVLGARCRSNGARKSCSRTVFTRGQLEAMEDRFIRQSFLTREERIELADEIQLTERQILVWFQNRR